MTTIGPFWVAGIPAPKGSARAIKRGGFAVLVASGSDANKRAIKSWDQAVALAAKAAMAGRAPLTGPIRLDVVFYMPRPPSVTRRHHTVKPDRDKLLRCLCDSLTGIAWVDDAQVVDGKTAKAYDEATGGGAHVVITEIAVAPSPTPILDLATRAAADPAVLAALTATRRRRR
jgi:Holliday junction resolvase RusA-like endonuclease